MGYIESVLQPDETVIETTRIHWWFVWRRSVLMLFVAVGLLAVAPGQAGDPRNACLAGAGIAVVLALLLAVAPAIERATTELAVTNRRIIHKRGLIRRHTIEMSRTQVESVDVDQSVLGRMLNFGDITVRGTGTTFEPFRCVASPLRFRSAITAA
ncbi:MAG TPA: PH domain-containing protein [Stellaceae bacterium]|nr:PH domain-containing protein [Stellaceae bacterium]